MLRLFTDGGALARGSDHRPALFVAALAWLGLALGCGSEQAAAPSAVGHGEAVAADGPPVSAGERNDARVASPPISVRVFSEDFSDSIDLSGVVWRQDTHPDDGPFSDNGSYFKNKGIEPPAGYRASFAFGDQGWLTAELYSRSQATKIEDVFSQVPDPAEPGRSVLRLASPAHTDAVVVRPTKPLPKAYRVSARVGFANFGDGLPGLNGYTEDGLRSGPWNSYGVNKLNGFYWLSIVDTAPRPHNNVWLHHHRKLTVDSCNHYPPWMEIYTGNGWKKSGERPVMMFALDGLGTNDERLGKPFISYAGGGWNRSGEIRAADSYKPGVWYEVSITRRPPEYTLEVSGDFKFGGEASYKATINYEKVCVWHYNQPGEKAADKAHDPSYFESLGASHPHWPQEKGWPDYFMLGEPHINYYQGDVLFDDIQLEVFE